MQDAMEHIDAAIVALRACSNGKERNKAMSKLEDARVWLLSVPTIATKPPAPAEKKCTCGPGFVDNKCPVHGASVL